MYGTRTASLAIDEDRCQEERLWKTVAAWQANNAGHQAISPNSLCYVKKNDRKSSLDL
jgi:hypothetical protein